MVEPNESLLLINTIDELNPPPGLDITETSIFKFDVALLNIFFVFKTLLGTDCATCSIFAFNANIDSFLSTSDSMTGELVRAEALTRGDKLDGLSDTS